MQLVRMIAVVFLLLARHVVRGVVVHPVRHQVALVQLVKEDETALVLENSSLMFFRMYAPSTSHIDRGPRLLRQPM